MAGVAQLVRAPDCDSGGRRFKPGHSPHFLVSLSCYALVAQLDRALPSEGKGRWFKSNQVYQCK
jgi:hypothetical protein